MHWSLQALKNRLVSQLNEPRGEKLLLWRNVAWLLRYLNEGENNLDVIHLPLSFTENNVNAVPVIRSAAVFPHACRYGNTDSDRCTDNERSEGRTHWRGDKSGHGYIPIRSPV